MEYIKVKDHLNLVRDPKTNAIINTNKNEYEEYMKRRNKKLSETQRVGELESDIEMIKNDLETIKNFLQQLVKGSD